MMIPSEHLRVDADEPNRSVRLGFGGVHVELLSTAPLSLSNKYLDCAMSPPVDSDAPLVVCSLNVDGSLAGERNATRKISLSAEGTRLTTPGGRVRLSQTGVRRWAATASVAPSPNAVGVLLEGLTARVLELSGGLVMHAAGVELDGRAFLFIGPSGAGKSTAAGQVFGGRSFTVDRVAISVSASGVEAWPLPGGNRPTTHSPQSTHRHLPLGGILRVVQAEAVKVHRLSQTEAVLNMRESIFAIELAPMAEQRRLDSILRLCSRVPVVRLETSLRAPLAQTLRQLESAFP